MWTVRLDIRQRWNRRLARLDAHVTTDRCGCVRSSAGDLRGASRYPLRAAEWAFREGMYVIRKAADFDGGNHPCFRVDCSRNRQLGAHIRLAGWRRRWMVFIHEPATRG